MMRACFNIELLLLLLIVCFNSCRSEAVNKPVQNKHEISKTELFDKIKGGWAGQVIGCTYGGPTEFKYTGTMINAYVPIDWKDSNIKWWYDNSPGLYDDVYMDLTFVEVFERLGLDAPVDSFAYAFANADYELWHANQAARYNILHGINAPQSGHWTKNPHADDLDYQIEADFAGLMSPGMPNSASKISDKIGHIMTYGDGWYGGVYVGAMYSLAFISNDIEFIVKEALNTIPKNTRFRDCIEDVIRWHKQFPDDWKRTWFECEKKWSEDKGCPHGTFRSYNIDAVINSAYVVIGLLYGKGDFFSTMDIATRCGQDSDCNPATATGILGVVKGYSNIPMYWMKNLKEVEDMNFAFTDISLNKAYQYSFKHALEMIERNGGKVEGELLKINHQIATPVRFEQGFEGHYPVRTMAVRKNINEVDSVLFKGNGAVFKGEIKSGNQTYVAKVQMLIDDKLIETISLPVDFKLRRQELFWVYNLTSGDHVAKFKWLNPRNDVSINFGDVLIYSDKLEKVNHYTNLH